MEALFENFRLYDREDLWCMEVRDGVIESLEKKENFKSEGKFSKIYDLNGNYLLPGFVDAHMHFSMFVALFSATSLRDCRSIEELKERLNANKNDFVIEPHPNHRAPFKRLLYHSIPVQIQIGIYAFHI
jgi:Predicted metal-dependent hydrolase with the TIM-barrel fold